MSFQRLARELRLSPQQKNQLMKRLNELEKKGIIFKIKRKYFVPLISSLVRGRFDAAFKGYGFVTPEGGGQEDIFIPPAHTAGAVDGDFVEVLSKKKGKKGKPEGRVIRILEKGKKSLVGFYRVHGEKSFLLPLEAPFSEDIPIVVPDKTTPLPGMIVEVERATRRLKDILGMPDEPGVDTEAIIRKFALRSSFSNKASKEAQNLSSEIPFQEKRQRVDYRGWTSVTIDGLEARDFDDAVSIKKLSNRHYLLGVHIADVSHYVRPDSSLDDEAFKRSTSVYFPDRTLPMLPEKLSNNICSLRPQEEKLTLSVILEIDKEGRVVKKEFFPSLIQTKARMTYDSVYRIFEGDREERRRFSNLVPDLMQMRGLARLLNRKRREKGSLDFDLTEPELIYREGNLVSVLSFERNEAHRVIEEFMLAANEAVASMIAEKNIPLIYRVHPQPAASDLRRLSKVLNRFGIQLPQERRIEAEDLQQVLDLAKGKPWEKFINVQVLRSLRLAIYSEENRGHFGLAKEVYTHFTSPIRRYPDLEIHRVLKGVLKGEKLRKRSIPSVAFHCSQQERKAEEAERELLEWRIFRFLKKKLGEEVEGTIVDISKAGLAVELDNYFVEGLASFSDIGRDYYHKRYERTSVGLEGGRKFALGDRVKGILASVDPVLRRATLTLKTTEGEKGR